jgi:hypothetical protein
MSKHKLSDDDAPAKRPCTSKWRISLVTTGDDRVEYTDLCYAKDEKMRDDMLFLYSKVQNASDQRVLADYVHQTAVVVPQRPPATTHATLKALVQACEARKLPMKYIARMYKWRKVERRTFAEILLDYVDAEAQTFALDACYDCGDFGALEFDNDFSETGMALIWLQLETNFVFIKKDKLEAYSLGHASFPHVPPEFVNYACNFIDYDASKSHDFWIFTRDNVKDAVVSWLKCKDKKVV